MAEKKKGRPSRFRLPKSASEEQVLADEVVPSSTKYKNKWGFEKVPVGINTLNKVLPIYVRQQG